MPTITSSFYFNFNFIPISFGALSLEKFFGTKIAFTKELSLTKKKRRNTNGALGKPYPCSIGAFGPAVYKRAIQALELDSEYFNFKDCASSIAAVSSPKGQELDQLITNLGC